MPGMACSTVVRSTHASRTVRTRRTDRLANEALWSEVKQTTSHRPVAGRPGTPAVSSGPPGCGRGGDAPGIGGAPGPAPRSEGNRFSNTTTS